MLYIAGRTLRRVRDTSGICSRCRVVICPSGGLLTGVSSPLCKNISVFTHPKSLLELSPSHPTEGRIAIVTDAGWDAVDAAAFCARGDRRARDSCTTRAHRAARRERMSAVIACDKREAFAQGSTCDEAIHSFYARRDGLRRFARNDGVRTSAPYLQPSSP